MTDAASGHRAGGLERPGRRIVNLCAVNRTRGKGEDITSGNEDIAVGQQGCRGAVPGGDQTARGRERPRYRIVQLGAGQVAARAILSAGNQHLAVIQDYGCVTATGSDQASCGRERPRCRIVQLGV